MKKKQLSKLAILGITSGLLASQLEAAAENTGSSLSPAQIHQLLAKHACKGPSGCAGLVAESDAPNKKKSSTKDKHACKGPSGCAGLVAESDAPNKKKSTAKDKHACKGPSGCAGLVAERDAPNKAPAGNDYNDGNLGYHLLTEDELLLELNAEGTALYNSLSPEGKKLALQVASQRCDHTNACKGLNACATDTNSCAGKGSCEGKGKCALADKNLAVKLAAQKMAQKRAAAGSQ